MTRKRNSSSTAINFEQEDNKPTKYRKFGDRWLDSQNANKSQIQFTLNERRSFLKACQENGLNIIYDIKTLQSNYLPTRSETELKYLIDSYERRAKLTKECDDCKDTPLEVWYSFCEHSIRSQIKRDDSSLCLIDLMQTNSGGGGDDTTTKYNRIYDYIKELMIGKYPSNLTAHDSIVFLSLISELTKIVQNSDLSIEKGHIINLYRQFRRDDRGEDDDQSNNLKCLNYFEQFDANQLKCIIQQATTKLNNSNNSQQTNSNEQIKQSTTTTRQLEDQANPLYQYGQLPKLKKIRECLNPLKVSVEIAKHLRSTLNNSSSSTSEQAFN